MRQIKRLLGMAVPVFVGLALAVVMLWLLPGLRPARAEAAAALFVKTGGTGSACTQAAPCTLPTALGKAVHGDTVYLGAGAYTRAGAGAVVTISKSIGLYGGWNGAGTGAVVRNPRAYTTTLDGQNQRRVVYISPGLTVTLEGLGINRGQVAGNGGGLYASGVNLTLRDVRMLENAATGAEYAWGGAVMLLHGNLLAEGCLFERNSVWGPNSSFGGAMALSRTLAISITGSTFRQNDSWWSSGLHVDGAGKAATWLVLRDNTFISNGVGTPGNQGYGGYAPASRVNEATARIEGNVFRGNKGLNTNGALVLQGCDLELNRNWFLGNQAGTASALVLDQDEPCQVTNNVIAAGACDWDDCSAIQISYSYCQFTNNTIAGNKGASAILVYANLVTLTNTILVSHTLGVSVPAYSRVNLEGTLWGAGPWATGTWWGGAGTVNGGTVNIVGLPGFVNAAAGDYHLLPTSAAIDAGVPGAAIEDLDRKPRPWGAGWDIGAYEYRPPGVYRFLDLPLLLRLR